MSPKPLILVVLLLIGMATAEKITFGNRRAGDTLLLTLTKSTLPTNLNSKHELDIDEKDYRITYVEFNVYPSAHETVIRKPTDTSFTVKFINSNTTQLIGDYRVFGFRN